MSAMAMIGSPKLRMKPNSLANTPPNVPMPATLPLITNRAPPVIDSA